MADKSELTKVTVAGSRDVLCMLDGKTIGAPVWSTVEGVDWPVLPSLLNIIDDYISPDDPLYKEVVALSDEIALRTRAYYLQWISFFHKNDRDYYIRKGLKGFHEKICKVPHPFIDEMTKTMLKLKEDNYEHIIVRERRRSPKASKWRKKGV